MSALWIKEVNRLIKQVDIRLSTSWTTVWERKLFCEVRD